MKRLFKKQKSDSISINDTFKAGYYQRHNIVRLKHLDSLGIDFNQKNVLEIGAGIGDHSYYLQIKGAKLTSTDARAELVEMIKNRFGIETFVLDAEKDIQKIENLPKFDIIYCYGLLYHLGNPAEFIRALKGKSEMLLMETCVSSDHRDANEYIIDENEMDPTQAKSGKGCRPTRNWIANELKKSFEYVYYPLTQPEHDQFPLDWNGVLEDRKSLIRAVFIGSDKKLDLETISLQMPVVYKSTKSVDNEKN